MKNPNCKVCGTETSILFSISSQRVTGQSIDLEEKKDCPHYICPSCGFVFHIFNDRKNQKNIYNKEYWDKLDMDSKGRLSSMIRLLGFASMFTNNDYKDLSILDFGCGLGLSVDIFSREFGFNIYGHDIITPQFGKDHFISDLNNDDKMFDLIIACEVLEHLPDPIKTIKLIWDKLNTGGIFIFETAYFHSKLCDENWWYLGPKNGHCSFYSIESLDYIKTLLKVKGSFLYKGYHGIQALIK